MRLGGGAVGWGAGDAVLVLDQRPPGYTPRRSAGLTGYERVLARAGFSPVAGIDEAGRGACAGPLVVAAVVLDPGRLSALTGVADSKTLTAAAREAAYRVVTATALAWHVVIMPPGEIDEVGLHVCNIAGMRRALAGLTCRPAYVLTDGFPVRGLGVPALAMWKGDEVAACVAAASVVAKVTRDRLMHEAHRRYPEYGFARHKGYATPGHMQALSDHGPCPEHRLSFTNVGGLARGHTTNGSGHGPGRGLHEDGPGSGGNGPGQGPDEGRPGSGPAGRARGCGRAPDRDDVGSHRGSHKSGVGQAQGPGPGAGRGRGPGWSRLARGQPGQAD